MAHATSDPGIPESRALTGLRGIAAVLVVMHHASLHIGGTGLPAMGELLRRGYLGVDLFFVLSGFVISMVYGFWFTGGPPGAALPGTGGKAGQDRTDTAGAVAVFLMRRAARVWPLHAAVLAALLADAALSGGPLPSPRFALANFMLVQGWGVSGEINAPAWSVSTEFLAYLLFPLLAGPVLRRRWGAALGLAAVAALLAACLALAPTGPGRRGLLDIYQNYSVLPAMRCLAGFLLGMLAWRAGQRPEVARQAARPWVAPGTLLLALGMMLAGAGDLLVLALLPVMVLALHHGRGRAWRLFTVQPLHGLGTLSYAIYLIHYALLPVLDGPGPVAARLALYALATLLLAALAHQLVERPTRRLVRWMGEAVVMPVARPAFARLARRGWAWRG
jgi:peptidoglycan/LPS O-acetylase OafA/YrhL